MTIRLSCATIAVNGGREDQMTLFIEKIYGRVLEQAGGFLFSELQEDFWECSDRK